MLGTPCEQAYSHLLIASTCTSYTGESATRPKLVRRSYNLLAGTMFMRALLGPKCRTCMLYRPAQKEPISALAPLHLLGSLGRMSGWLVIHPSLLWGHPVLTRRRRTE